MYDRGMRSLSMKVIALGLALLLPSVDVTAALATGGAESLIPGYKIHAFTETGSNSFAVAQSGYVDVLLIGGGGGGGRDGGGGGGAGGFVESSRIFVEGGSNYTVIVGSGGLGATTGGPLLNGARGVDSTFAEIVAHGGGSGGTRSAAPPNPAIPVGSGGGGAYQNTGPFLGTPRQGHAGGMNSSYYYGGGGGGADADGENGKTGGAAGGAGRASVFTGTETNYAGGGGGGTRGSPGNGVGGLGGGGDGGDNSNVGQDGMANTGGGGGGSGDTQNAGKGGSGIAFIRYQTADSFLILGSPANLSVSTPPYGITNGLDNGDALLCSVPSGWLTLAPGTRTICTGYELFTNDVLAVASSTNAYTYTHDDSSGTLVWQWQIQHEITFTLNSGGTISTNGGWYNEDANVTVTATVTDPSRSFSFWLGDVPAGMESSPTLTFAADQPRAIAAHFGGTNYVSKTGLDTNNGFSWETAKLTLYSALENASDGDTVLVNDGIYDITNRIDLTNDITLRSVNGAENTRIQLTNTANGIFYLSAPGAMVDGFTIATANGAKTTDGAVYFDGDGTVNNCIIRDITIASTLKSAYGGGVRMETGGLLKHCRVINNKYSTSDKYGSPKGGGIYMSGSALVESCVISNNIVTKSYGEGGGGVDMAGGTLRNSLVFGNSNVKSAGGVYATGGTIESCTIVSNSTSFATGVGGLYNSKRTIRNSIIQFNMARNVLSNYENSGAAKYYNCSTYPTNGLTGSDNLDDDPLFKNLAHGDCRLKSRSPCLNAGLYQEWMEGALDLAGGPRILNKLVDIGAYEGRLPGGTLMLIR